VDPRQGKKSATRFELIETFAGYSLLRCRPVSTCRHHQIRVHLRSAQLPLVGDPLYGGRALLLSRLKPGYRFKEDRDELPLLGRSALHAERLNVIHPVTGLPLVFEAPWPKDLQVALKFLRRYAPSTAPATPSREPSEPTGGNKG
jgi:23S rRNA-/tRNA-specific pseudouridylate synthase